MKLNSAGNLNDALIHHILFCFIQQNLAKIEVYEYMYISCRDIFLKKKKEGAKKSIAKS